MKSTTFPILFFLCFYAAFLRADVDPTVRVQKLQASLDQFPMVSPMTDSSGQLVFQSVPMTNSILIGSDNYYGFRLKVPQRTNAEDFVWAFTAPPGSYRWYIVPEKGDMMGFSEYFRVSAEDYSGAQNLPRGDNRMNLQTLAGNLLNDGETYLIWFNFFDGTPPAMSVAWKFVSVGQGNPDGQQAVEAALGLKPTGLDQPLSRPIVNPDNQHSYVLLRASTWKDAEAQAVAMGGHLATVRNQAEEDWLLQTFGTYKGSQRLLWIGLSDRDKKFHFAWSSGESMSFTAWAAGEPNNAGRGEDFVAIYYPNHSQRGKWNDWDDTDHDPIGLPMDGVVEIVPPGIDTNQSFALRRGTSVSAPENLPAVQIRPMLVITNDGGFIKLEWPLSAGHYMLEATTNLTQSFQMFGYSELTNVDAGNVYVTISNPVPRMFFRLRQP